MTSHRRRYNVILTPNARWARYLRASDAGVPLDIAIRDFSKAFGTAPREKLLHKIEEYGVRGNLHKWLTSFLQERQMNVVVEEGHSESAPVGSGIPQGLVYSAVQRYDNFILS